MILDVKMKKALEAPSNMVVLIIFIAILAIIVVLVLFFGQKLSGSEAFNKITNFSKVFKWG